MLMTTTLSDVKAMIIRNTSSLYQDEIVLRQWVNDALVEISLELKLEGTYVVPYVQGTVNYALPEDYRAMRGVIVGKIEHPTYVLTMVDIASMELGYAVYNGEIIFKRPILSDEQVTVYYTRYPSRLVNDTDIVEIEDRYVHVLAMYAMHRLYMLPEVKDVNAGIADRYLKMYEDGKMQFKTDMQERARLTRVNRITLY